MGTPPRLAHWLMQRILPPQEREFSLGDLDEEFADRVAVNRRAARRWYWRQVRHGFLRRDGRRSGRESGGLWSTSLAGAWRDGRYAWGSLRRSPGFVAMAAATLALGVGANAAIYALIDAVLLRGLPFEEAEGLVILRNGFTDGRPGRWLVSFPDYEDYRAGSTDVLEHLAAWQQQLPAMSPHDGGTAERLNVVDATWNLLPTLGIEPVLGRGFTPEEDAVDSGQRVALLSHALWRTRFGADEGVVGRTLRLDGLPYEVVGVLPRGFTGVVGGFVLSSVPVDMWLAYRSSFSSQGTDLRGLTNVNLLGRIADGITFEQAETAIGAISRTLDETHPELRNGIAGHLLLAEEKAVEGVRSTLLLAFGSVSLLLLIAWTNVANLLLGRGSVRQREMAIRTALGAGRVRLVRQCLAESVIVAAVGAALGTAVAWAGVGLLKSTAALEIAAIDLVQVDLRVVGFLVSVSLVTGLVFGVGPALHATRTGPQASLKLESRTMTGSRSRARQTLVVAQMALAVVLLVGAGLLLRSLQRVLDVDPGFAPQGVLTARVRLAMPFVAQEPEWRRAVAFFERLEAQLEAVPGVRSAPRPTSCPQTAAGTTPSRSMSLPTLAVGLSSSGRARATRLASGRYGPGTSKLAVSVCCAAALSIATIPLTPPA